MHSFGNWYRKHMRDADGLLIKMDEGRKDDMRVAYEAGALAERKRLQDERDYAVRWANKAVDDVKAEFAGALWDIRAERQRQVDEEGFNAERDDKYTSSQLAFAASCYAYEGALAADQRGIDNPPPDWPWHEKWWKPTDRRRDLVKAGALIVAEIERLDRQRAASKPQPEGRETA